MISARPFVLRSILTLSLSALTLGLAPGCGGDSGEQSTSSASAGSTSSGAGGGTSSSASSGTGVGGGEQKGLHLSGTLSYEYVPYDVALDALDYGMVQKRPIRGASVRLLDADTSVEIAKTVSTDSGAYAFDYEGAAHVKLWVYAETAAPVITVEDNTQNNEVYVVESPQTDSAADAKLDFLVTTGWGGKAYTKPRASAPFAVLDAAYTASRRFLDEATPPPQFQPLKLNWSIDNRPEDGDKAKGQIGTSHWDGDELYILGKEDVDTDEFDSHILVHEWGHAFEARIGRSDTIGGTHAAGDVDDPRVAWSEGFCNALSAMILDPDTVYADSSGAQQASGFSDNIEKNDNSPESSPGWFSERTVEGVAFDLYDGANEPFDKVSIGLNGVYAALLSNKKTPALTTLFSFVGAIKQSAPQSTADIDALTSYYKVSGQFGVDSITDAWGTGETHTGGVAGSVPVYKKGSIGTMYTVDLSGTGESNQLSRNVYYLMVGDGMPVTVKSTCSYDVDLKIYHYGDIAAKATTTSGNETLTFDTVSGEVYVLTIHGDDTTSSYSADVSITH